MIVTAVPVPPVAGVKSVIVKVGMKVNPLRVAVPPGVVTTISPLAEPGAGKTRKLVEEITSNVAPATPPSVTADVPVKFVPVIVTHVI